MAYKVIIDPHLCAGTSNCVEDAPEAYEMDLDRALATLKLPQASDEALLRGAKACPMQAISILDSNGRRVFP